MFVDYSTCNTSNTVGINHLCFNYTTTSRVVQIMVHSVYAMFCLKENAKLFDETPSGLRDHKMSMCDWDVEVETGFSGKQLLNQMWRFSNAKERWNISCRDRSDQIFLASIMTFNGIYLNECKNELSLVLWEINTVWNTCPSSFWSNSW